MFYIIESLVCNDIQESRINKLHSVMSEYIYDYKSWGSRLMFTQINARNIHEPDTFNKVSTCNTPTVLFFYLF